MTGRNLVVRHTATEHSYDQIALDLAAYIEDSIRFLTEAMKEDGHAPFEAEVTDQERYDYFHDLLWNPDGTPNTDGRSFLETQYGLDGYVSIYRWVERKMNRTQRPRGRTPKAGTSGTTADVGEYQ